MRRSIAFFLAAALVACGGSSSSNGGDAGGPPPDQDADVGQDDGGGGDLDAGADGAMPGKDASRPPVDAGVPSQAVSIIVEPSDDASALLSAIQNAKSSVHMTMYLLDDSSFINALIAQHNAGHDVKVLLNQNFPTGGNGNTTAFNKLQQAGVSVEWAPSGFALTHEKCVILDGTTAWIMTMNLEFSSPSNREYLAIDTDATEVAEAEAIFEADFANRSFFPSGTLVVAPGARPPLLALIQSATKTIDVEAEELSDSQIVSALAAAQGAGVTVRVVLSDSTPTAAQQMAETQLKAAGVRMVTLSSPYVHAKAMVVDGQRMYVGSANFTASSLQSNRELGILTRTAAAVNKVAPTIAGDFSKGTPL